METTTTFPIVPVLLGGAILLGVVFFFGWAIWQGGRVQQQHQARLDSARPAQARIIQVGSSTTQARNGTVTVKLRLEIQPAGAPAYAVTTRWQVEHIGLAKIQEGQSLAVKVDAQDDTIVYPNAAWAEYANWDGRVPPKKQLQ